MKVAMFGAGGMIGQRIARELVNRGHEVTSVQRDPAKPPFVHPKLVAVAGDALSEASIADTVRGEEAVVSAVGPSGGRPQMVVDAARSLIAGCQKAGVVRLIAVGGAGVLEVAPGVQLVDSPNFPAEWKQIALAHREALAVYRQADLDWTYFSPAALIEPGERTGQFRVGSQQLIADAKGQSRISAEDYAMALVDELEQEKFVRRQMTVGY